MFILLLSFLLQNSFADHLTLYFYPSPKGINWDSPKRLLQSAVANLSPNATHTIGHVNVELACDADSTLEFVGTTGGGSDEVRRLIINEKVGMGLLFHTFSDGRLFTKAEIASELNERYQRGNLSYLNYLISPSTCRRLKQYIDEYRLEGLERYYGLPNRPRYREGGGCSAFGVSFLELAGLLEPTHYQQWSLFRRVPWDTVGGPLTGNRVPIRQILLMPKGWSWAMDGEPYFPIHFWSPDQMHGWVQKVWDWGMAIPKYAFQRQLRWNAKGMQIDASNVPTPTDPIWR